MMPTRCCCLPVDDAPVDWCLVMMPMEWCIDNFNGTDALVISSNWQPMALPAHVLQSLDASVDTSTTHLG